MFASREKTGNIIALNESYEEQIDKLTNNAVIVSEKLNELNDLEYKIRDMVGLNISETASVADGLSAPLSRSADRTVNIPDNSSIYVPEDSNEVITLIENEKEIIDKFSKDLEERLDFLDARPDQFPATGRITSPFGFRIHPTTGKKDYHKGIDIANEQGTPIFAAGSGVVTYVGYNGGYGRMIIISHGYGYKSVYAHLKSASVNLGDAVEKGNKIALMGSTGLSTGSHLHFEIHYNGKQINPLNILED
ncbi:MAG: peptidoglycan DD-metalloendopeptidase family protein [Peptostreptococcaceae bacterium]|nr:peptidoglycan DD-metalloendopeptidase family protein [Peptostreptococcaceae bacterium]